jgi:iron complex outermembrane receptor protein
MVVALTSRIKIKIMVQLLKITIHYLPALRKASRPVCLTLIFFTFWGSVSFAQNGIIKGKIKDREIALQNVTVSVAQKNTLTNSDGEFSFTLEPGPYTLIISHVGYKKKEETIILHAGETQFLQFNMIRDEQLGEVVVLGSRSGIQRSNLNTAVPVDRISSKELKQTGQPSLIQMLNFATPSFNTSRQNLSDPVTLRGLGPDHLLILLNGTRYHNLAVINPGAIKGTLGRGSVSNDLNSIPFSAIEKIEILRDGASAQYGSDAIAGVMNIELKKTTRKTSINLHLGQQYKGDGENGVFGINRGISLNKKGFLNFSGDLRYRKPTYRGGEYLGTVYQNYPGNATRQDSLRIIAMDDSIISARGFNRKTPVSNDGSIQVTSFGFSVNGGYPVNSKIELFWTGTVNYRHPVFSGAYRFPKNPKNVNTVLYPDGFKPINSINTWDLSGIAGARGKTNKEWNWEWNSVFGKNSGQFNWKNTNNASQFAMGANAPTEFYGGSAVFKQQTNTISLVKDFAKKINGVKTFNIGFGAEYRFENFQAREGEQAAWDNYDPSGNTQPGAQPSPGITPDDVVNENRRVAGLYVDVETDINDHLLINMAGRFEDYNDFGNNLAGKLAMRYKLSSAFSIRGSVSNGYHAPALQQIYYSSIIPFFKNIGGVLVPVRVGIFRNNSDVAKSFGVKPLQPEKSVNLSSGFTATISTHINLTVDAYWIQIKNRIVLSGRFDRTTDPDVNRILQNRPDINVVQFLTNAINAKTCGIDIVMNGNRKIRKANLSLMLDANFTRTNIFGPIQLADSLKTNTTNANILFDIEEREKLERGQPGSKIILSTTLSKGKFEFVSRNTRFGNTASTTLFTYPSDTLYEFFPAKILTDISVNYTPKTWLTITAGANNVFNLYPDRLKNYRNTNEGILKYGNEAMPFGYNGGYYFVSMAFNW